MKHELAGSTTSPREPSCSESPLFGCEVAGRLPGSEGANSVTCQDPWADGINWPVALGYAIVHLGALSAPFFFTWKAVALAYALSLVIGAGGLSVGFHRLLTHGSFRTFKPVRYILAFLGHMAGQSNSLVWVSAHRKHHVFTDRPEDPHSPRHGALWSHIGWILRRYPPEYLDDVVKRYCPDLLREPMLLRMRTAYLPMHLALAVLLFAWGYFGWDAYTGASFVAWAFFLRLTVSLHVTLLVNSAAHYCGYRNYETDDDSRNVWWLALITSGEGWHNNHHACQRTARHGHRWWELDAAYGIICALEKCGLAWDVVHDVPQHEMAPGKRAP